MAKTAPISIGLTGSIGMGKSTVAGFFADLGAEVWDADAAVHRLYDKGGRGVAEIEALVPNAISDGMVDRKVLSDAVRQNPGLLQKIEDVIHPLVALDRAAFRQEAEAALLIFDVPLLFEGDMDHQFDHIVVVSAAETVQRDRVLARPGMTPEKFDFILSKQMPDVLKRARADFVVETDVSFEDTREQVKRIYDELVGQ